MKVPMRLLGITTLVLLVAAAVVGAWMRGAQGTAAPSAALVNGSFDDSTDAPLGWSQMGEAYGTARVVSAPVVSPPGALELRVRDGATSAGNDSFMVYQTLVPSQYRGRRVKFGARILTQGGAVNLTLFTPEGSANDFFDTLQSGDYTARGGELDVPLNASFVSLGIQIMGASGAKAYVDDVYVLADVEPEAAAPDAGLDEATVSINVASREGPVNPLLFGGHLEWTDGGNGLVDPKSGAWRPDAVQALTDARLPILRFPGGIHADYYDWRPGAQPFTSRPPATNVFTGRTEPNAFGSLELLALARKTGAQLLLTANYGTGTPDDAADWAAFLRKEGVSEAYWEVGNEIYLADPAKEQPNGRRIARTGAQYAADFPKFLTAIRGAMPDAKVGIIAHLDTGAFPLAPASRRDWTVEMLAALAVRPDFAAVHNGYAPVIIDDSGRFDTPEHRARLYRALYGSTIDAENNLTAVGSLLDRHPQTRDLPVAITEWGPLFGYSNTLAVHTMYVDQSRTLAAAIFTASMLDMFLGQPRVLMATYTNPIHRWYGSLFTHASGAVLRSPASYVYEFYRSRFETELVTTAISGPTFDSPGIGLVNAQTNVPQLIGRAAVSSDGRRLTVILVNRSLEGTLATTVRTHGLDVRRADCRVLTAAAPHAVNGAALSSTTLAGPPIEPAVLSCAPGPTISLSLPASSVTSLILESD